MDMLQRSNRSFDPEHMDSKVKVLVRICPNQNCTRNIAPVVSVDSENAKRIKCDGADRWLHFDYCHSGSDTDTSNRANDKLFQDFGVPLVQDVLQKGHSCCLLAYGTMRQENDLTMLGDLAVDAEHGLIPRVIKDLFLRTPSSDRVEHDATAYKFKMSYVEVSESSFRDLLMPSEEMQLKVEDDPCFGPQVQGAYKLPVYSFERVLELLRKSQDQRSPCNARTHTILTLSITKTEFNHEVKEHLDICCQVNFVEFQAYSLVKTSDILQRSNGHFAFMLQKGSRFPKVDVIGSCDAYVKFVVGDRVAAQSKVIPNSLEPVWNCLFSIEITPEEKQSVRGLRLEIYDHNTFTAHRYLGQIFLEWPHLEKGGIYRLPIEEGLASKDTTLEFQIINAQVILPDFTQGVVLNTEQKEEVKAFVSKSESAFVTSFSVRTDLSGNIDQEIDAEQPNSFFSFENSLIALRENTHVLLSNRTNQLNLLLGSFFCRNFSTSVVVNVRPDLPYAADTLRVIQFAQQLMSFSNKVTVRMDPKDALIKKLKFQVTALSSENKHNDFKLEALASSTPESLLSRIENDLQSLLSSIATLQKIKDRNLDNFSIQDESDLYMNSLKTMLGNFQTKAASFLPSENIENGVDLPPLPPDLCSNSGALDSMRLSFEEKYHFDKTSKPKDFGVPWLAVQKDSGVAVQVQTYSLTTTSPKEIECLDLLHSNMAFLRKIEHPNIVALWDYIEETKTSEVFVITQRVGQNLSNWLYEQQHYTENVAREIMKGLLSAVAHVHSNGSYLGTINTSTVWFGLSNKPYDACLTTSAHPVPLQETCWECKFCTFKNKHAATVCEVCQAPQLSMGSVDASQITCNTCTLINSADRKECEACQSPLSAGENFGFHVDEVPNFTKVQPLVIAAKAGNSNAVKIEIEAGVNINTQDLDGYTALIWAACFGHADVCQLLLEHDADANLCTEEGWTALHAAENNQQWNVVALLQKFELAKKAGEAKTLTSTDRNVIYFTAPEVLRGSELSTHVDIWSLGVMLFFLLSGCLPFQDKEATREELEHRIKTGIYQLDETSWGHVSPSAKDLLRKMLQVNPAIRPSATDLLLHPWIQAPADVLEAHSIRVIVSQFSSLQGQFKSTVFRRRFADCYELGSLIEQTASVQTNVCTTKIGGLIFAVKQVNRGKMSHQDIEDLEIEIAIMREINHQNIIKLVDVFIEGPLTLLISEPTDGKELLEWVSNNKYYNEMHARSIMCSLLETLAYVHSQSIVLKDLTPGKVLIVSESDCRIKLVGLRSATYVSALSKTDQNTATPQYMAPELLRSSICTEKIDVWSAGVMCYVLLGGYLPFQGDDTDILHLRIKAGTFHFHMPRWEAISENAKDIIQNMLTVNPMLRLSADYLLQHSWFQMDETEFQKAPLHDALARIERQKKFKRVANKVIAMVRLGLSPKSAPTRTQLVDCEEELDQEKEDPEKIHSFHESYAVSRVELGRGAFGVVHLATCKYGSLAGQKFAAKAVDRRGMSPADLNGLEIEVQVMQRLIHNNVIRLFDHFVEKDHTYLVLELVTGGELFDRIVKRARYTEDDARILVFIFLDALRYLHEHDVVHRDLKPENLLLSSETTETNIKIADFGFAIPTSQLIKQRNPEVLGSPAYMAPEMLKYEMYNEKVDIWSAGVIVYALLGGYQPFQASNNSELYNKIKKGNYSFDRNTWGAISNGPKRLIKKMLVVDPRRRPSAKELLKDEWLQIPKELLPSVHLQESVRELKSFNALRKFKAAGQTVLAATKFAGGQLKS